MVVNQWVPAAHRGDAIGDSARRVRDLLRGLGHRSDIFALTIDDDMREEVRPFSDADATAGDVTIFHFALPSPMSAAFARLPRGRVLQYHNITPAHFFAPYDPGIFRIAALGRQELATLAERRSWRSAIRITTGGSCVALGFREDGCDADCCRHGPDHGRAAAPALEKMLRDGLTNFLFVGRIAPNKRIEDIIRLAEQFKRYIDARYRFIFVGRTDGVPRYYAAIRALVRAVRDAA